VLDLGSCALALFEFSCPLRFSVDLWKKLNGDEESGCFGSRNQLKLLGF